MNEQDKLFVDGMRSRGDEDKSIYNLLGIIDDLDKQLTEIKEAGEPIGFLVAHIEPSVPNGRRVCAESLMGTGLVACLDIGHLRRLAEALKGVKDE